MDQFFKMTVNMELIGLNTFYEEAILSKLFCFPSEKGSVHKGKHLLPLGAHSFLF